MSEKNKLTEIANQLFNVKEGDTVIKSLVGDLQVPPKDISKLFSSIKCLTESTGKVNKADKSKHRKDEKVITLHNFTVKTHKIIN